MRVPCRGCPDRDYPHCHMVCERYKAFRAERDKLNAERQEHYSTIAARNRRFEKWETERLMRRKREGK